MRLDGQGRSGRESFDDFQISVRRRLAEPLPGVRLHAKMAPSHRKTIDPAAARNRSHRVGAVLILLFPSEGQISTVFTVRHSDLRHHAGQISFPGGRREPGESLVTTAIREAEEEVGINRGELEILGPLTPLFIPPSRFIVHPFLAATSVRPVYQIQESEVEAVLEFPIADLLDPSTRRLETWDIGGEESQVPYYQIGTTRIWGATAMITSELLELIR